MAVTALKRARAKTKGLHIKRDITADLVWERPTEWLQLPDLTVGDQKMVGLVAIFNHDSNYLAFTVTAPSGCTIDWGDGSAPENFANNVQANHLYDYATVSSGTLTSDGYKQVIVTITPQAGNITAYSFGKRHSALPAVISGTGWLDMKIAGTPINSILITGVGNQVQHNYLKQFEVVGTTGITSLASAFTDCTALESIKGTAWTTVCQSFANAFTNCYSLKTVPLFDTHTCTSFNGMFANCTSLSMVPLFNTSAGTTFSSMFTSCRALKSVPLFDTANGTQFFSMFATCTALESVPLFNTSKGTAFNSMFATCTNLKKVPLLDLGLATNVSTMFSNCQALQSIPLFNVASVTTGNFSTMFSGAASLAVGAISGARFSISYQNCKLSAAELNRVYTNLGTASGAQTITVTGNPGVAGDDPTIATAKGWTVTGS